MVLQSDPVQLREKIEEFKKLDSGSYTFFWNFFIKLPLNPEIHRKANFFDRKYDEWLEIEPVIEYPIQEHFESDLFTEVHEDEQTFWIMDRYDVTLEKVKNGWKIKIIKNES
ncbi:MAG: hypothetical protein FK733_02480 [Asgard group archaeon]|nr:hypothetical protein [Asgard group archaeon]